MDFSGGNGSSEYEEQLTLVLLIMITVGVLFVAFCLCHFFDKSRNSSASLQTPSGEMKTVLRKTRGDKYRYERSSSRNGYATTSALVNTNVYTVILLPPERFRLGSEGINSTDIMDPPPEYDTIGPLVKNTPTIPEETETKENSDYIPDYC